MPTDHLSADIPICDPDGWFIGPAGSVATTPGAVAPVQSAPLSSAIFSVLQFGAIVPPLAPWPGVHRALPGYRYARGRAEGPVPLEGTRGWAATDLRGMNIAAQAAFLEAVIDQVIVQMVGDRTDPVVLFSGGVDSGFLANRLRSLGYRDTLLLNYAFGEGDKESMLAEHMAKLLGLRFERVIASPAAFDPLLNPGEVYPQPFADHSVVPTSELAHAVVQRLKPGSVVLDGTGADGGFGLGEKIRLFRRLSRVPGWILKSANRVYQDHLWRSTGSIERVLRVFSRMGQMPFLSAMIAQNPLAGKWYSASDAWKVYESLSNWVEPLAGSSLASQVVTVDLALVCANVFAQKAKPIFNRGGCKVHYPFMSQQAIHVAQVAIDAWPVGESKSPLKHSLSKALPREMIYRPKSAFADPAGELFFKERFLQHLRATAEDSSPLAGFIQTKYVKDSCDLLRRRWRLPSQTLNMLWAITFTDRWYRTATPGSGAVEPESARD